MVFRRCPVVRIVRRPINIFDDARSKYRTKTRSRGDFLPIKPSTIKRVNIERQRPRGGVRHVLLLPYFVNTFVYGFRVIIIFFFVSFLFFFTTTYVTPTFVLLFFDTRRFTVRSESEGQEDSYDGDIPSRSDE